MRQPLWRFVMHFMLLVFVVHRAAAATVLYLDDPGRLLMVVGLGLQCVAGTLTSFGVLFDKPWAIGALVTTAALVAATALYGALGADVMTIMSALAQALVAALAAGGLAALLRHEHGK